MRKVAARYEMDPLLKDLKAFTLELWKTGTDITDDNENLLPFCQILEAIFQKGLVPKYSVLGFSKSSQSWNWIEHSVDDPEKTSLTYATAVFAVKACSKVSTPLGRLRLLIRTCLVKKCLDVPIERLVRKRQPNNVYDTHNSILGHEVMGEIFLSVLLQCSELNFKLNLANSAFLDDTWQLPHCVDLEFVPCKTLGLCVSFVKGKAVIASIESTSVAAENDLVEVGDVLLELNGKHITSAMLGKLTGIMKKGYGQPVLLRILKARHPTSGEVYTPVATLVNDVKLNFTNGNMNSSDTRHCSESESLGSGVTLVGSVCCGEHGEVSYLEHAIQSVLRNKENQKKIKVIIECQEMKLRVIEYDTDQVLYNHSYMEISSCGRTANTGNYFAYIAGEKTCNLPQSYMCYVYHCNDHNYIENTLLSIGQGFQRTHFAV